jgi:5-formyltetrahydrofolate cyclo-ligase
VGEITETKAELRRILRAEGRKHSAVERSECSRQLCDLVKAHKAWQEAEVVLLYVPLADEPDISRLIEEALLGAKTVALPRYSVEEQRYCVCQVADFALEVGAGAFGIKEPRAECPVLELKRLDLLLIPGVGFSLTGGRLGRGKGHYDRLLAEAQGRKCGVAFDWQITDEIPIERHDILLEGIVTPTRWHNVAG